VIRPIARRVLSDNVRHTLHVQAWVLKHRGPVEFARWHGLLVDAAVRERMRRHRYTSLTEAQLRSTRRSDTVFVFGSGASLNDITPDEWTHIAAHDTFGFTAFIYQQWIPVRYHLLRGGIEGSLKWRTYAEDFCAAMNGNALFHDAILILQGEYSAMFANQILGYGLVRPGTRMFRYHTAHGDGPPTRTLSEGVRHIHGTLTDAVNVAVCMGWTQIVLAGVDLYDSRYFWLPPDKTIAVDAAGLMVPADRNLRGHRFDERHNTALNGVVKTMGEWRDYLERERGVHLSVFNPRSLLAEVMPVYGRPGHAA
jgi:hypothetical protein